MSATFERVLLATDGSDAAERAAAHAAALAAATGAAVHVLHVVDERRAESAPGVDADREAGRELVESIAAAVRRDGVATETAVRTGNPSEVVVEYAADEGIDCVVVGSHGRTGVERLLLGSVAERVVRRSDVPVLVVREAGADVGDWGADAGSQTPAAACPSYRRILFPTDGSERSRAALDVAVALATAFGADLHVLSVVEPVPVGVEGVPDVLVDVLEDNARAAVDDAAASAREAGLETVETAVTFGTPYREIREYAGEHDVDLVVMGTHGRGGIERLLLGSVAERTVRTAPAPVLTVRAPDAAGDGGGA